MQWCKEMYRPDGLIDFEIKIKYNPYAIAYNENVDHILVSVGGKGLQIYK